MWSNVPPKRLTSVDVPPMSNPTIGVTPLYEVRAYPTRPPAGTTEDSLHAAKHPEVDQPAVALHEMAAEAVQGAAGKADAKLRMYSLVTGVR